MSTEKKPVTLRFSTVGIEVIESRTWSFSVPYDAVSTLKKLCEQIGLCRDFIQDFDFVPSLVKTKFYIKDTSAGAYIVSGNWEGIAQPGGFYEIILKPNRDGDKDQPGPQGPPPIMPPPPPPEEYAKMPGPGYYDKMGYAPRKY